MSSQILIEDASLNFRMFANRAPKLKELLVERDRPSALVDLNQKVAFPVLRNISLRIDSGERVGVIGFNGAGKSTLLRLIMGIYPPDSGAVTVRGSIAPLLDLTGHFDFELTGRENIYLKGSYLGFSQKEMKTAEFDVREFAELGDFINVPVKYYSSGMVARLAFAISTTLQADICLLDEVFAVGDAYFVEKAVHRMHSMLNRSEITVMVSHNVDHLREICGRILWLHDGVIMQDGATDPVLRSYREFIDAQTAGLRPDKVVQTAP
jgi:ABC-type polysaccharide/polyol phosphate transport system ATPase subunit